jgi:hypothetical protein
MAENNAPEMLANKLRSMFAFMAFMSTMVVFPNGDHTSESQAPTTSTAVAKVSTSAPTPTR